MHEFRLLRSSNLTTIERLHRFSCIVDIHACHIPTTQKDVFRLQHTLTRQRFRQLPHTLIYGNFLRQCSH